MSESFLREKNDLIFTRCALQQMLQEATHDQKPRASLITVAHSPYTHKVIYRVRDERLADQVRQKMLGLERLRAFLETQGQTLRKNARIWLPAVADPLAGDTQINLTASENWVTREMSVPQLYLEAERGRSDQALPALCAQSSYRLCRRSGHHYRVAIRNPNAHDAQGALCGRRVQALNDFAIILSESLPLNLPRGGVRAKNRHAWRGVTPALFTMIGARGQQWLVYPGA
ncbi:hypothetical protein [Geoalkalibacter halelectricus]|uniref:hypothetical protein n=1 Tax=Geoalkalibacter halelectricus TaxID=2847045 RepID=UPI003D23B9FF